MTEIQNIDCDIQNLSSFKLGYLIRLSNVANVTMDTEFIKEIRTELIERGHYNSEIKRQLPH